jgi:hypothetical protein
MKPNPFALYRPVQRSLVTQDTLPSVEVLNDGTRNKTRLFYCNPDTILA